MPINPLIALGVRTPDAVPLVENFTRGIHHRRQQGIQNDLNARREDRAQQVHDFNVDEAQRQIAAQGKEASVADYAQDMLRLQGALSDGNHEEAGRMLNSRVARLDAIASQNPGANINSNDTREFLQMLAQDPNRLAATVNREVKTLERLGTLKPAPVATAPNEVVRIEGDDKVTYAWDPVKGKRVEVARGPRTGTPGGPSNVTIVQQAGKALGKGLTKEQEKLAEIRAGNLGELQKRAFAATEQLSNIQQLRNIDITTGFGTRARGAIASAINALGGDGEAITGVDPGNAQAFRAVTGRQVLNVMSTQKGPQTKEDQAKIAETMANLGNEPKANDFILSSLEALNLRRLEHYKFFSDWISDPKNNGSTRGAAQAWLDRKLSMPMISDSVMNADTGLPMFYFEFEKKIRALPKNADATQQEIEDAWRKLH